MGAKVIDRIGKSGFHLIIIFGLLHYEPVSKALGDMTVNIKVFVLCLFFVCVFIAGDKVIENTEKNSGAIFRIFVWVSDIVGAIKNGNKSKNTDDERNT